MNAGTSRFSVERQEADGSEWFPVTHCNSLVYVRMVAAAGWRRRLGDSYRIVHRRTGKTFVLRPEPIGPEAGYSTGAKAADGRIGAK